MTEEIGYFIIEKGYGPIKALGASVSLTKGVKLDLLAFFFILTILNVIGLLLIVGLFVTFPISAVALAYVYRSLVAQAEQWKNPNSLPDVSEYSRKRRRRRR